MYAIKIVKRLSNDFGKQHFKEVHLRLLSFTTELHVDRIGEQFGIKKYWTLEKANFLVSLCLTHPGIKMPTCFCSNFPA